jgi:L-alanine-DL-glutamate epimerase-like enolase superfamily enzyme
MFKEGLYPQKGILKLPDKPGLGLELNEEIITNKRFLEF